MTLSFLWSAIIGVAKKTMGARRFVVPVMLFSLVVVVGCDVRPFNEFNGDDNGSEESSEEDTGDETDGDEEMPDETAPLELTPTILETSVNTTQTIDLEVVDPEAGRTYMFAITTPPTNGEAGINNDTGVLTYTPDADSTASDSLVVTVTDDGVPSRSGTATIEITVDPG